MVIYLNTDGTAEKVTPQHVYQGSNNVIDITVIAPYPNTCAMEIGFILPNDLYWQAPSTEEGKYGGNYAPMESVTDYDTVSANAWNFVLPITVTQMPGKVGIAIKATTAHGERTSYLCEFIVEESILPILPASAPEPSVYQLILQYLGRLNGRTANVPNLVAHIDKATGNSFTYTDNKGIVSAPITLGEIEYDPTYVNAASTIAIPKSAWQQNDNGSGYTAVITAGQHGQMGNGVSANDLWVSFDETVNGVITGDSASYTVDTNGDITITVVEPVDMTVRVWNGKGLIDQIVRDGLQDEIERAKSAEEALHSDIMAEQTRAESAEAELQAEIDHIEQSGVDLTARTEIQAEIVRATNAEAQLQSEINTVDNKIAAETNRATQAEQVLQSDIDGLRQDINEESHFRGMFMSVEALKAAYPTATPNDYAYIVGGNIYIWQNNAWQDSEKPSPNTAVPKGTSTPLMDGVGSAGVANEYAAIDHRHPSDTNKINKSGDTMTGPLTLPNIVGAQIDVGSGATQTKGIVPVRYLSRQELGVVVAEGRDAYIKAWIKKVCSMYPGFVNTIFIGAGNIGNQVFLELFIYDTDKVDVTTGLPEYAFGIFSQQEQVLRRIEVTSYVFNVYETYDTKKPITAQNVGAVAYTGSTSVDLNTISTATINTTPTVMYSTDANQANSPTRSGRMIITAGSSANYGIQVVISDDGNIYMRKKRSGNWEAWATMYSTANMPPTPNLDNGTILYNTTSVSTGAKTLSKSMGSFDLLVIVANWNGNQTCYTVPYYDFYDTSATSWLTVSTDSKYLNIYYRSSTSVYIIGFTSGISSVKIVGYKIKY